VASIQTFRLEESRPIRELHGSLKESSTEGEEEGFKGEKEGLLGSKRFWGGKAFEKKSLPSFERKEDTKWEGRGKEKRGLRWQRLLTVISLGGKDRPGKG